MDLPTLQRQLKGDLDWITMKALEKDRTRRYGSPMELAADVEKHLRHEPVSAGPPSAAYRTRKFVRRHRFGVGAGAVAVVTLVAFAAVMGMQARRIAVERDRANEERETAEQVSTFLAEVLGSVDPASLGIALWKDLRSGVEEEERRRDTSSERIAQSLRLLDAFLSQVNATDLSLRLLDDQLLAPAAERIESGLSERPRIRARLEHTLAETYRRLGLYERARQHGERSVETLEMELGPLHRDTLAARSLLGWIRILESQPVGAEEILRDVVESQLRTLGEGHADTLESKYRLALARARVPGGGPGEAEPLYRDILVAPNYFVASAASELCDTSPITFMSP